MLPIEIPETYSREIVTTRILSASRERVFAAWTTPELVARWWGPAGFRNTFETYDLRPGGDWRFVMHGPDGTDYANHSVFREIVAPERLVFEHVSGPRFLAHVTFVPVAAGTKVTFRMLFDSAELCTRLAPIVHDANEQNFDRLAALL